MYEQTIKDITEEVPRQLDDVMCLLPPPSFATALLGCLTCVTRVLRQDRFAIDINKMHARVFDFWQELGKLSEKRVQYDHYVAKNEELLANRQAARIKGRTETPKVSSSHSRARKGTIELTSEENEGLGTFAVVCCSLGTLALPPCRWEDDRAAPSLGPLWHAR